jgi:hypothetical protein
MTPPADIGGGAIAVVWDAKRRCPSSFVWRRRRYRIQRVVQVWVVDTGWWSQEARVHRRYWRVHAEGRFFDLSFDRVARVWRLEHVVG